MIEKTIAENGNLLPSIINLVESIPSEFLNHRKYNLRHPKVIAYRSIDRVFKSFLEVINEYNSIIYKLDNNYVLIDKNNQSILTKLSDLIIELLSSIVAFTEDCLHIFKCIVPYTVINEKFIHIWLKKAKHPTLHTFYNSIKDYRNELVQYTNEVKHNHGRIDVLTSYQNQSIILGYTVKEIDSSNNNSDIDILDFNQIKTIIPNLQYHFYQLYHISELFVNEFKNSFNHYYNEEITLAKSKIEISYYKDVIKFLGNDNEQTIFLNELYNPITIIRNDSQNLKLEYPIGITNDVKRFLLFFNDKGKDPEKYRWILYPTDKTLKLFKEIDKERKEGKEGKMELNDKPENFGRIYLSNEESINSKKPFNIIKCKYDNLQNFKNESIAIISYSPYKIGHNLIGGVISSDGITIKPFKDNFFGEDNFFRN